MEDIRQVGIALDIRDLLERWMGLLAQQDVHKHRCQKRPYNDTSHRKLLGNREMEMVFVRDGKRLRLSL